MPGSEDLKTPRPSARTMDDKSTVKTRAAKQAAAVREDKEVQTSGKALGNEKNKQRLSTRKRLQQYMRFCGESHHRVWISKKGKQLENTND